MKFGKIAAVFALSVTAMVMTPPASGSAASLDQCWYHVEGNTAYYRNCATVNHWIHVDKRLWPDDWVCVAANTRKALGHYLDIRFASFDSSGCNPGA